MLLGRLLQLHMLYHYIIYYMAFQLVTFYDVLERYGVDGAAENESILASFSK